MQGQLGDMQKSVDSKLSALQASVQQALDTANKTSSSVSSLNSGVTQTMRTELKGMQDQLTNVTGLSTKVDLHVCGITTQYTVLRLRRIRWPRFGISARNAPDITLQILPSTIVFSSRSIFSQFDNAYGSFVGD